MENLTIIGWTDYDSDYPNIDFSIYPQNLIIGLLVNEIKNHNYLFSGRDHQYSDLCVPVFSNGCVLRSSMRAWGMFMALAYNDMSENNIPNYMNYYDGIENSNIPTEKADISCGEENDALPVLVGPDQSLIQETLSLGIDLITYDKAIKYMYPLYKQKLSN